MVLDAEERRRINRQNGQRSTGPKTIAGKFRSSLNATTHGLSAQSAGCFGGNAPELRDELDCWIEFYKPTRLEESALIERAVVASIQQKRCIAAAHRHVLESRDSGEAVAAILGCGDAAQGAPVLSLYLRYERMHRREFQRAFTALLPVREETTATAPAPGLADPAGPFGDDERGSRQVGYY
jgi:hypothetical protein